MTRAVSKAERARRKAGRPRKQGDRTPSGQLSRATPVKLEPIPEQVRRGAGDGRGPIDDPFSILERLGLITTDERRIADAVEAAWRAGMAAIDPPRPPRSALDGKIAGVGGDLDAARVRTAVARWNAVSEALRAVGAYAPMLATLHGSILPDAWPLLYRVKIGLAAVRDLVRIGA